MEKVPISQPIFQKKGVIVKLEGQKKLLIRRSQPRLCIQISTIVHPTNKKNWVCIRAHKTLLLHFLHFHHLIMLYMGCRHWVPLLKGLGKSLVNISAPSLLTVPYLSKPLSSMSITPSSLPAMFCCLISTQATHPLITSSYLSLSCYCHYVLM